MRKFFYRFTGLLLLVGALLGAILSVFGLVTLWRTRPAVTQQIITGADLASRSLHTTTDGLVVVRDTITNARSNLSIIRDSTRTAAETLIATRPTILNTADLIGTDMPGVIDDTRRSLTAAEDSARLVDDTLRVISAIPFIGARYKPEVPLQTSIAQVSDSLRDLPDSFTKIRQGIVDTADSLQGMQTSLDSLATELEKIETNIDAAGQVTDDYIDILNQLSERVDGMVNRLPGWIQTAYLVATLTLAWLIVTQIAIFTQAIDWLTKPML